MGKKCNLFLSVLSCAFLIAFVCPSLRAYAAQEFYPFLAEVISDNVHIRAGQSENFESLLKIDKNDEVVVVDKSYSWYKIELPSQASSYVSREFVLKARDNKGIITANRLNVRGGPGPRFAVLNQLQEGEEVDIVSEKDGWFQIKPIKKSFGWIRDDLLNFKSKDVEAYRKKHNLVNIKVARVPIPPKEPEAERKEIKIVKKEPAPVQRSEKKEDVSDLRKKIVAAMEEKSKQSKAKAEAEKKKIESKKKEILQKEAKVAKTKESKKIEKKEPPVDRTLAVWEEFNKLKKSKKNDLQFVSVKGYIQPQKEMDSKDIKYKFLINNKPVFYIRGFKHILEEFVNFQVELEGSVVTEKQIKQTFPVVEIHKIQLVL